MSDSPQLPPQKPLDFERERGVTTVAVQQGVSHITVRFDRPQVAAGRLAILNRLAEAQIPIFLVKLLPEGLSFSLRQNHASAAHTLLTAENVTFRSREDLAVVSTIAGAMRDLSGVIAQIYEAFLRNGITVRQTGDAHNAVLCLVDGDRAEDAARALRVQFEIAEGDA